MKYFVERKSAKRLAEKHLNKVKRLSDDTLCIECTASVILAVAEYLSAKIPYPWREYLESKVGRGDMRVSYYHLRVTKETAEKFPFWKYP